MTSTTMRQFPAPPFIKRLADRWRRFFFPGDILTLVIIGALLLIPPLSLRAADWPLSLGVLIPVTVMSASVGLILSRSQFSEFLALVMSSVYGVCIVLLITAIDLEGGLDNGVYGVFERTATWLADATSGGINQDDLVFTLLVAVLFWFLGYNAAWHTFRIDRIWRVILPPGLILISNTIFYDGNENIDFYVVVFLFLSLLLIARSHLDSREWEWYQNGIRAPRNLRVQFLRVGAVLALATLAVGWAIPSGDLQERLDRFQEFLQSEPLREISEFWNRLFSPVEAQGPTTADYYGGESLELGGAIRLGDQTVMLVEAPPTRRYYWRSRVFDTYEGGRWTPAADTRLTDSNAPLDIAVEPDLAREEVRQRFTVALNASRLVYTAPQPLEINLPTRADLFYTSADEANRAMSLSVIRPLKVLRRGDEYTATSLMTNVTADQLRGASIVYPEWVSGLYLYVSPSVTQRTRDLARQVVNDSGATTVYDQAKAIERYLRANITYNESIPQPPRDRDPVDWVLFDLHQGYCNYYATSMIVMLRSLGIPARMAAGFAQGVYDPEENAFVVTERDAHTWVEVYFPGYGWIEFEPTAAQAPLEREGDNQISQPVVAPPQATPTPTVTPSPEASPTPEATSTPPPDENLAPLPTVTPSITPTFTPTPTATPVIIPTRPAPITPESQNPIELLLPALGLFAILFVVVIVVLMIATFIWWWWEWRGMRGMSPVARAYARLERYMGLLGVRLSNQQTPFERRRQIIRAVPKAERPVNAITRMYTSERYGPGMRHPAEGQQARDIADKAWGDARGNILSRWARRFFPWLRNKD